MIVVSDAKIKSFLGRKWVSVTHICFYKDDKSRLFKLSNKKPNVDIDFSVKKTTTKEIKKKWVYKHRNEMFICDTSATAVLTLEIIDKLNVITYDQLRKFTAEIPITKTYKERSGFRGEYLKVGIVDSQFVKGKVIKDPDNVSEIGRHGKLPLNMVIAKDRVSAINLLPEKIELNEHQDFQFKFEEINRPMQIIREGFYL